MKESQIINFRMADKNCDWVVSKARELKALFLFNSEPMVARNKVRSLANIDTMQKALEELKQYIEGLEG